MAASFPVASTKRHTASILGSIDRAGLPGHEQRAGQQLDGHRGGPLAHAGQHGAVAENVHVATLQGGRQTAGVVVSVVPGEVRSGEHRVVAVDRAAVQRLPLAGGLGPHHVVEQQFAHVPRCQPGQLKSGPVHDDLAELADF